MELYAKNVERTLKAVHMEKVDKIPFSYSGPAYMARHQGLKISEFVSDPKMAVRLLSASVKTILALIPSILPQ